MAYAVRMMPSVLTRLWVCVHSIVFCSVCGMCVVSVWRLQGVSAFARLLACVPTFALIDRSLGLLVAFLSLCFFGSLTQSFSGVGRFYVWVSDVVNFITVVVAKYQWRQSEADGLWLRAPRAGLDAIKQDP